MSFAAFVEGSLLAPLDAVRRRWLTVVVSHRPLGALLLERDRRVASLATVHAAVALVAAIHFPILLLLLGPIVLGVAHLGADVRTLILRRGFSPGVRATLLAGVAGLVGLRVAAVLGLVHDVERLELGAGAIAIAIAITIAARKSGAHRRAALAFSMTLALAVVSQRRPDAVLVALMHGHNLVALALFALLYRRPSRILLVPLVLILGGAALLATGALGTAAGPGASAFRLSLTDAAGFIAPGLDGTRAGGVTAAYVFLQSIHYAVWLLFVPQGDRAGRGASSFRAAARAWRADLGGVGLIVLALAALAVLVGGCVDVRRTRDLYLSLAMFHGTLELVMLAYLWVGGPDARRQSVPARRSATP
jgi:hypothetical protein